VSALLLLVGLLFAVLGAAASAALVTTTRSELADAVSRRLRGAQVSFAWLADRELQVISSVALGSLGVTIVGAVFPGLFESLTLPQLVLLLLFVVVPATLAAGYLVPRLLTRPRAERVVAGVGGLIRGFTAVLRFVLPGVRHPATEGIEALAREGSASGVHVDDEFAMVGGVMSFAERPIREVMTARTDVVGVSADADRGEVLRTFAESGYTRLPVYRDSLDEIIGMVHAFDLFKLESEDPIPVRPVVHAPETRSAADLLIDMQHQRRHLAVVIDEFGGTAGLVTLEDLLEALVGEIADEDDAEESAAPVANELLEIDGTESVETVAEHFGTEITRGTAATFAGLLVERLGRIPRVGERFRVGGLDVDVIAASPARVARLVVRLRTPAAVPLDRERGG